jgi:CBS domain-containing protein
MAKLVRDLMNKPITLAGSAPVIEAAREMRAANVGTVVVEDETGTRGIVTDRDIAVRAVAAGLDPASTPLSEVCSLGLTTVSPDDDLDTAVKVMRENAIRRVLVVDSRDRAVGIISLGDLAIERDSGSVLGQISAAPPTQ